MGYRKITVDGVEYQYVIGRTHVKVHGMQAVPKEQVGELQPVYCRCCQMQLRPDDLALRVEPHHVAEFIRRAA